MDKELAVNKKILWEKSEEIDILLSQVNAILDLMSAANSCIDAESINVAAEMCMTMLDDISMRVDDIRNIKIPEEMQT